MKRFIIYFLVLVSVYTLQAQQFRFGFTASPGLSWMTPDNKQHDKNGSRFGMTYGIISDYTFGDNERYALNAGLVISMGGGNVLATSVPDSLGNIFQASLTPKLQYLEIPVGLKLRSNVQNKMVYYGLFGLTPGFTIRNRAKYTYEKSTGTTFSDDNIRLEDLPFYPNDIEKTVPFHLGLQMETGLEYSMTENTALVVGLFFNNGFTNVIKDNDDERVVMRKCGLRIGVLF